MGKKDTHKKIKETAARKQEITKVKLEHDYSEVDGIAVIDGSTLEGGGQILRNSVSLSALLAKPVRIVNIRANRAKPGLKAQHLTGIQLVRDMYQDGALVGGTVNSSEIQFKSKNLFVDKADFEADTKTAGSIGLLIQVSLPCAIFAPQPISLTLKGGTNAEAAPQIDYTTLVFKPMIEHFGVKFDVNIIKRGFYPQGGGIIQLKLQPIEYLKPIHFVDRGEVTRIYSRAFVSNLPADIAIRMNKVAKKMIRNYFGGSDKVVMEFEEVLETKETAVGNGTGIIIVAYTSNGFIIAGSALGERGKPAEKVGEEAANMIISNLEHGGCVDEYLQDQLILFMALAKGKSTIKTGSIQLHTETSIKFASHLTGSKFTVSPVDTSNQTFLIECEGIGYQNPHLKNNASEPNSGDQQENKQSKEEIN